MRILSKKDILKDKAYIAKLDTVKIILNIIKEITKHNFKSSLIVGCGEGKEALALQNLIKGQVYALDIRLDYELDAKISHIMNADARLLPFRDESFDFIYCHHVFEHILNYKLALREIYRVLKNNGVFYIGVPNKKRAFCYLSSGEGVLQIIKMNAIDYKKRLFREFDNEKGAHAGFKKEDLIKELGIHFEKVAVISSEYYQNKYKRFAKLVRFIAFCQLDGLLFPGNYFICIK